MHRAAMSAAGYGQPYRSGYGEAGRSCFFTKRVPFFDGSGEAGGGGGG